LGNSDVDFSLVGWAAEAGGTIGGRNGRTVQAATGAQIVAALSNRTTLQPLTILVTGTITPLNTGADKIDIKDMRDVSIIGVGGGGEFDGIGIKLWRTGNVVLRNLEIHHVDIGEMDAVSIAGPTDHVWVDHCEFYSEFQGAPKGTYDGLVDIKDDAEYITLSWNYLHDSWGTSIVGATEDDTFDRKLTMHHNWLSNVNTGAPSVRGGTAHVFSNYYEDIETIGVNSRIGACVRLENNFFIGVTDPWVSAYSSVVGDAELVCDSYEKSLFTEGLADVFELGTCSLDVPYEYSTVLTHVDSVAGVVQGNAGVGKLTDPRLF
jgi:pectate lyase